ncbi:MAG: photosystem II complex extrinsic protein PsbU [Oscillatoriales cyanobacterium RM2_1_1]|nr:photosystem II complex extrinsic protein PsbU [Oscillatoriales cyanobacterium SM2_3_0]NJO44365.1 photosystem II complex extrinsic protein PsbU [Oscillatoriales cyanobacterium RM2_1_1]
MKRFFCWLASLSLLITGLIGFGTAPAIATSLEMSKLGIISPVLAVESRRNRADEKLAEVGEKLDLNNSSIREFRQIRGMFPTLAKLIIDNAPYDSVEDVLEIPNLTQQQADLLRANLDLFTVTPETSVLQEGNFRLNTGTYD